MLMLLHAWHRSTRPYNKPGVNVSTQCLQFLLLKILMMYLCVVDVQSVKLLLEQLLHDYRCNKLIIKHVPRPLMCPFEMLVLSKSGVKYRYMTLKRGQLLYMKY